MARVTVEDCLDKLGNHFKVVQVAGHRARQLEIGSAPKVEPDGDKSTVIALREIAGGLITEEVLDEPVIDSADLDSELSQLFTKVEPGPMMAIEEPAEKIESDDQGTGGTSDAAEISDAGDAEKTEETPEE